MIKTTINTSEFKNTYSIGYYNEAMRLAEQLEFVGYNDIEVLLIEECSNFQIVLTVDGNKFRVSRDYDKNILISLLPYNNFGNVSMEKRKEVYNNTFVSNKIKVVTKKKIDNYIIETLAFNEKMQQLNNESLEKIKNYLATIKQLENEYNVSYNWNGYTEYNNVTDTHDRIRTTISGGYITKNGIQFNFEIDYNTGYISEKVILEYSYNENKIDMFKKLSDNKYIKNENN